MALATYALELPALRPIFMVQFKLNVNGTADSQQPRASCLTLSDPHLKEIKCIGRVRAILVKEYW